MRGRTGFGRLIVECRRRLTLTQEELARRSGLGVRTIRDLETGRGRVPRPASVRLLADAFGLDGVERERFVRSAGPTDVAGSAGGAGSGGSPGVERSLPKCGVCGSGR